LQEKKDIKMEIRKREQGGFLIVSVSGRLDAITSPELDQALSSILTGGEKGVVLDFETLDYISSAGLRVILAAAKRIKKNGGESRLACLKGVVKEVFEVSGFESIIPCFETAEAAVRTAG
jgi:anti-sigma B factor antagonist